MNETHVCECFVFVKYKVGVLYEWLYVGTMAVRR